MPAWYTDPGDMGQTRGEQQPPGRSVPAWLHPALALWILTMLLLARYREALYAELVQEDRVVEWATVFLFLAAAVAFAIFAWRRRRLLDAGVALFCLAAAGEEVSWGQRILGFTPAATFLERNAQQEANLHNLVEAFGQPKWTLVAILVAYGVAAPALARVAPLRRLAARFGLSIVPWSLAPWFGVAVALLAWYPVRFTGEWVEAMAGALFLAAAPLRSGPLAGALGLGVFGALAAERASAHAAARPEHLACAVAETRALRDDIVADTASSVMTRRRGVHRRLHALWLDADLDSTRATRFHAVRCATSTDASVRRRYGVDPWGTAYWVRASTDAAGERVVSVYSFGPNRRRDAAEPGDDPRDDVIADGTRR